MFWYTFNTYLLLLIRQYKATSSQGDKSYLLCIFNNTIIIIVRYSIFEFNKNKKYYNYTEITTNEQFGKKNTTIIT